MVQREDFTTMLTLIGRGSAIGFLAGWHGRQTLTEDPSSLAGGNNT
jgi:uncharacterized membrane protein (Fun14 family)